MNQRKTHNRKGKHRRLSGSTLRLIHQIESKGLRRTYLGAKAAKFRKELMLDV
jgi:hypothetical protein